MQYPSSSPETCSACSDGTVFEPKVTRRRQPSLSSRPSLWRFSSLDALLGSQECESKQQLSRSSSRCSVATTTIIGRSQRTNKQDAHKRFRSTTAEVGFCLSMAITQLLAEYLISGFSMLLPSLTKGFSSDQSTMSYFWPASILSLILCSTILTFGRVSDMYGGYVVFMSAVLWLCLWTFIAGFSSHSLILLNICRAMQGLSIAAYTPSTYALFGAIYPAGPRRNFALGVYGASSPLGLYAGLCVSAALPENHWHWYFWIAAILAFVALVLAYLSVPSDRENRLSLDLSMDWAGAITITTGLILIAYALAFSTEPSMSWRSLNVLLPFILGIVCLLAAIYIEARVAASPLLPLEFFKPKSVKTFALACLFFYGCFGTWLFTSTLYFQEVYNVYGMTLAAWYTPVAVGGFLIATTSGVILHRVPPTVLLLASGFASIAAPLLLALAKPDAGYWAFPFPSMICSTLGVDLAYTISIVFLSSVQPLKYQGLAGAVSSLLVNMGIAFSLAFATIIEVKVTEDAGVIKSEVMSLSSRSAFFFATASAVVGVIIVVLVVRIPRAVVDGPSIIQTEQDVEAADVNISMERLEESDVNKTPKVIIVRPVRFTVSRTSEEMTERGKSC